MAERSLAERYRLHAASFLDTGAGARWRDRLGPGIRPAIELLSTSLARDLAIDPRDLDREQLKELLGRYLPGRLGGKEPWRNDLVDLLEEFLLHVGAEEGASSSAWEWTSALTSHRGDFDTALRDPHRPRFGDDVKATPDRRPAPKIGRNDPCPCGSGKKYKHCCAAPG